MQPRGTDIGTVKERPASSGINEFVAEADQAAPVVAVQLAKDAQSVG
jgi:hypothetical protein